MNSAHSTPFTPSTMASMAGLLLLIGLPTGAMAQTEEERLANGEVLVSTEEVQGKDLPRVNVKAVVDAPPERVFDLVSSCERKSEILPSVSESHVVNEEGEGTLCSETFSLPFPLSDLVSVARSSNVVQGGNYQTSWELVRGDFEYSDGFFRVSSFRGDEDRSLLVYQNHFKPDVSAPDWLTGAFLEQGMPDMIAAIREAATSE